LFVFSSEEPLGFLGSCRRKVFLVPCPLVDPVDLKGTPASCKPTSTLPRIVLWLRDVPPPVA